jgi:long-chain acyl-CoA synthetase
MEFAYRNFKYALDDFCAGRESKTALRIQRDDARADGEDPYEEWSYGRLKAEAYGIASFLRAKGLRQGDRVAIVSENRPEWVACYLGAVASGLAAIPIDAALDDKSIEHMIVEGKAKALCASTPFARRLGGKARGIGATVIDFDADSGDASYALAASTPLDPGLPAYEEIDGDSVAAIIFTSGTTGISKAIMLSHRNIIANVDAAIDALEPVPEDGFITVLPFHHTYATTCTVLAPLFVGASSTIAEKLVGKVILGHIKRNRSTFFISVPLLLDKIAAGMLAKFAELKGLKRGLVKALRGVTGFFAERLGLRIAFLTGSVRRAAGLDSIRIVVSGGGPLAYETSRFFDSIGLLLVQGYGMSENSPLISVNLPRLRDNRSVGLPVKGTEVKIDCPNEEGVGEILVRSPSVMLGYMDNPEATAEAIDAEGWLHSGDLGYLSKRGLLYITGRSKNIIVTEGGKNIYPEEIELEFVNSPVVLEALVVGRKLGKDRAGEEVLAVCVPDREKIKAAHPGKEGDAAFVEGLIRAEVAAVNKRLPSYKRISDFVVRADEFEKTSTKKIRRFLYKEYAQPKS